MISGAFHVMSQDWRYYSREKSLFHTLHAGQLPSGMAGDTILIESTSPANPNNGNNNFSVPPFPGIGGTISTINITLTVNTLSTCYASVGPGQTILTQKNCIIQYGVWSDVLKEILFTPQESGWFMIGAGYNTDEQNGVVLLQSGTYAGGNLFYGFNNNFLGSIDRQPVGFTATQVATFGKSLISQQNAYADVPPVVGTPQAPNPPNTPWNPNFYLSSIVSDDRIRIFEGIAGLYFRISLTRSSLTAPAIGSDLTGWLFKFAEV